MLTSLGIFLRKLRLEKGEVFINNKNILAYNKNGEIFTTRWNLDELMIWLREFVDNMQEDPYPIECDGEYAALKDINAREFDSDDDDVLDEYFEKIYGWNLRHRWHYVSNGAILADVYFQLIGDKVEISWNNQETDEEVEFECK